jgi:hypothetical protein
MKARSLITLLVVAVAVGALLYWQGRAGSSAFASKPATYTSRLGYVVTVKNPTAQAHVTSPLILSGVVRGPWTYNAEFPVEIVDAHHRSLATGDAKVRGNWMTEKPVRFAASVPFKATTGTGFLILRKANPSQDRSMNDSVEVPITFG